MCFACLYVISKQYLVLFFTRSVGVYEQITVIFGRFGFDNTTIAIVNLCFAVRFGEVDGFVIERVCIHAMQFVFVQIEQ